MRAGDQSRQSLPPMHILATQSNESENMWELRKRRKQDLVGLSDRGWGPISQTALRKHGRHMGGVNC